jgi:hypothetical protein
MSGLERAVKDKHDATVKKATARVCELHSQGLLSLANNGKIMYGRDGEQKITFTKITCQSLGFQKGIIKLR